MTREEQELEASQLLTALLTHAISRVYADRDEAVEAIAVERSIARILAYGDARVAQERERIRAAALAIRADYPEDLFPTLPAAAGARLAIDRLLAALD